MARKQPASKLHKLRRATEQVWLWGGCRCKSPFRFVLDAPSSFAEPPALLAVGNCNWRIGRVSIKLSGPFSLLFFSSFWRGRHNPDRSAAETAKGKCK